MPSAAARWMSDGQMGLVPAAEQVAKEGLAGGAAAYDVATEFPTEIMLI